MSDICLCMEMDHREKHENSIKRKCSTRGRPLHTALNADPHKTAVTLCLCVMLIAGVEQGPSDFQVDLGFSAETRRKMFRVSGCFTDLVSSNARPNLAAGARFIVV